MRGQSGAALIVDDDPRVRQILIGEFAAIGWSCEAAATSASGIHLLQSIRFDIAVVDLFLRGPSTDCSSGLEVVDWLRNHRPQTLPVVISGHATLKEFLSARNRDAIACCEKPVTAVGILRAVEDAKKCGRERPLTALLDLAANRMVAFCDGNKTAAARKLGMSRRWMNDHIATTPDRVGQTTPQPEGPQRPALESTSCSPRRGDTEPTT